MQTFADMKRKEARDQRMGELIIGGAFAVVFVGAVGILAARVLWMFGVL